MIPAEIVLETSRNNINNRWTGADGSAADRIGQKMVVPVGRQSFKAKPGDTFFAIGSCFARNVEERLELAGAEVTSRNINVRDLGNESAREGGIFNKYTPVSILQELKWAAGIETYPEAALLPVGGGNFTDPYLAGKSARGSKDELLARRAEVGTYFAQAFEADVIILTLGLIESWVDNETGLSLNEAPNPRILARNKGRFSFETLSLEQCETAMEEIWAILEAHGKPGQKKIVTISPVPLGRTFTQDDIIIANMTSKSTLRVVAQRFAARTEGLDYYPSYEVVMHSDPNLSWQADRRHVSDVIVGHIIQTFLERYGVSPATEHDVKAEVAALKNDKSFQVWSENAVDQEALFARLNAEVNKYKNMNIKLQAELRQLRAEGNGA